MRESGLGHVSGIERLNNDQEQTPAKIGAAAPSQNAAKPSPFRRFLDRYFYLGMGLLVAAVVIYGFSHTIGPNLLHPDTPLPWILPIHAVIFASWVVLFITQSALVRASKVALHRRLGIFAATVGGMLPALGVTTALVMRHFHDRLDGVDDAALSLPFNDMITFSIAFGLAIYWRRRPAFHRRLMLIATCCLTGAAFARFPEVPANAFYASVDLLILLGVMHDLVVNRCVHLVYRHGLPCMMVSQAIAQYLMLAKPPLWLAITHQIMQWTA